MIKKLLIVRYIIMELIFSKDLSVSLKEDANRLRRHVVEVAGVI